MNKFTHGTSAARVMLRETTANRPRRTNDGLDWQDAPDFRNLPIFQAYKDAILAIITNSNEPLASRHIKKQLGDCEIPRFTPDALNTLIAEGHIETVGVNWVRYRLCGAMVRTVEVRHFNNKVERRDV